MPKVARCDEVLPRGLGPRMPASRARGHQPWSGPLQLSAPASKSIPLTCLGFSRRLRRAGSDTWRAPQSYGETSCFLRLWRRVPPRVWLALVLWTARVSPAPLRAVPQDVLDEEGGEPLGLRGWRCPGTATTRLHPRLSGLRCPEHPASAARRFCCPPAARTYSRGERRATCPLAAGTRLHPDWLPRAPGDREEASPEPRRLQSPSLLLL